MLADDMNQGNIAGAITWLSAEGEMRLAIPLMVSIGNFYDALNALSSFPSDSLDDQQFIQLETMLINLAQDSLTIYDIDTSQESMVRGIAVTRTPTSYAARNILKTVYGEQYGEDIPGEDEEVLKWMQQNSEDLFKTDIIDVYPNPSSGQFTVKYKLDFKESLSLFISDVTGKMLFQIPLVAEGNTLHLNISQLPAATYLIGITNGLTISSISKIVLIK